MKKMIIIVVAVVAIAGLVALMRYHPAKSPATVSQTTTSPTNNSSSDSTTTATAPTPAPTSTPTTGFKNGSYTGQAVNVGYGIVQVKAVVSGGKVTDVVFLQMPSGGHSSEVTSFAEPQLKSETLQAQSGNVDIVSGATQTSQGFIQSLQDALTKA